MQIYRRNGGKLVTVCVELVIQPAHQAKLVPAEGDMPQRMATSRDSWVSFDDQTVVEQIRDTLKVWLPSFDTLWEVTGVRLIPDYDDYGTGKAS